MDLIYTFEDTSVEYDYIIEGLLKILNNSSLSYMPSNYKKSVMEILNIFSYVFENFRMVPSNPDYKSIMLIWNTGATFGLTPFRSDFIHNVKANIIVKDVTKVNLVIGIGTTIHKFIDVNGTTCYLSFVYYHILSTYIQLFSPETYHHIDGGYWTV